MSRTAEVARRIRKGIKAVLVAGTVVGLLYAGFVRPRQLRWGATDVEVTRVMPGDDLVESPDLDATRAVTIRAPAVRVWPALLQHVPDVIQRKAASSGQLQLNDIESERWAVWNDRRGKRTLAWALYPDADGGTRLVVRERACYPWGSPRLLRLFIADTTDIVYLRRSLLAIKGEAEAAGRARQR